MGEHTDGKRGTGAKEGTAVTTSINAVGAQGMDPFSKTLEKDDDRNMVAPTAGYPGTHIISPSPGLDESGSRPSKRPPKGGASGRKASGGAGRRGGSE